MRIKKIHFCIFCFGLLFLNGCTKPKAILAEEYIKKAKVLIKKREKQAASIELKNALLVEKDNIKARLMLAGLNISLGHFNIAERDFNLVRAAKTPSAYWQVGYAKTLLIQKKYQDLLDEVRLDPINTAKQRATITAMRGHAWLALKDSEAAKESFEQALRLDATNVPAILGRAQVKEADNKPEAALYDLNNFLLDNPDALRALVMRGFLQQNIEKPAEALKSFEKALTQDKEYVPALIGQIYSHIALFQPEKALSEIENLPDGLKKHSEIRYLKGLALFQNKKIKASQDIIAILFNLNPGNSPVDLIFSITHLLTGEILLAEKNLRNLQSDNPKNKALGKLLSLFYLQQGEMQRAQKVIKSFIKRYPEDIEIKQLYSATLIADNQFDLASEILSDALKIVPHNTKIESLFLISKLLEKKPRINQLKKILSKKVEYKANLQLLYIQALLKQNAIEKALKEITKMELDSPDKALIYNLRGLVYTQQQAWNSAQQSFEKALKIQFDFYPAQINLIKIYFLQGLNEEALFLVQNFIKKNPKSHIDLVLIKFRLLEKLERTQEALKTLISLSDKYPDNSQIKDTLISYYLKIKQPLKALALINDTKDEKRSVESLLALGRIYLFQNEPVRALRVFKKVILLQPNHPEGYLSLVQTQIKLGQMHSAKSSFRRAEQQKTGQTLDFLLTKAQLLIKSNRYRSALKLIKELQKKWPNSAKSYQIEAQIMIAQAKYEEANKAYRKALQQSDYNTKIIADFVLLLFHQNKPKIAQSILDKALKENPQDLQLLMAKSVSLQKKKLWLSALQINELIHQSMPNNPIILNNIAWLLFQQDKHKEALDYAFKAHDIAPANVDIMDTYGWILAQIGDVVTGGRILEKAHRARPEDPSIFLHTAKIWFQRGKIIQAREAAKRIRRLFPKTQYETQAIDLLNQIKKQRS